MHVSRTQGRLSEGEHDVLLWILENSFDAVVSQGQSQLGNAFAASHDKCSLLLEVGPRLNFSTAFSTNAVAICRASGLKEKVERIERSLVYLLKFQVREGEGEEVTAVFTPTAAADEAHATD